MSSVRHGFLSSHRVKLVRSALGKSRTARIARRCKATALDDDAMMAPAGGEKQRSSSSSGSLARKLYEIFARKHDRFEICAIRSNSVALPTMYEFKQIETTQL